MTAITASAEHFDVHGFIKTSKTLGVDEKVAEFQARQIEKALDIALSKSESIKEANSKELATKSDVELSKLALQKEIKELETTLRKEMNAVDINLRKEMNIIDTNLRKEIHAVEVRLMMLIGAQFVALLGILAKGFHWF